VETRERLLDVGRRVVGVIGDPRNDEYEVSLRYLRGCNRVLDVGCGTGTFLALAPDRTEGIDINPDNVAYCAERGLKAVVGDALDIPFPRASFDAVFCSHVMQCFTPGQAATLVRELGRVTRKDGVIVISTLNWFHRFFRHPENVRAYPPDAIQRYFDVQRGAQSPMFPDMPRWTQEAIWLRRPPLYEFSSPSSRNLQRVNLVLNLLQYRLRLRKLWSFPAYVVKLRNVEPTPE